MFGLCRKKGGGGRGRGGRVKKDEGGLYKLVSLKKRRLIRARGGGGGGGAVVSCLVIWKHRVIAAYFLDFEVCVFRDINEKKKLEHLENLTENIS